jgi:hypothetical protein
VEGTVSKPDAHIDDLVAAFARLPGAILGEGPDHPRCPDPSLRREADGYFRQYPYLLADLGYVAFIRRYWWAGTEGGGDVAHVHIFAPWSDESDPTYPEEPIEPEGYLTFALATVWRGEGGAAANGIDLGFGFDATGARPPGIYRVARLAKTELQPWTRYCDTFAESLGYAIRYRGALWEWSACAEPAASADVGGITALQSLRHPSPQRSRA